MKKLRKEFWERSSDLINWMDDEELRVMKFKIEKEMEGRLAKLIGKQDRDDEWQKMKSKRKAKTKAIKSQGIK